MALKQEEALNIPSTGCMSMHALDPMDLVTATECALLCSVIVH